MILLIYKPNRQLETKCIDFINLLKTEFKSLRENKKQLLKFLYLILPIQFKRYPRSNLLIHY